MGAGTGAGVAATTFSGEVISVRIAVSSGVANAQMATSDNGRMYSDLQRIHGLVFCSFIIVIRFLVKL